MIHSPFILMLTGVPGAGKSTISDTLASTLPCCAHLQTDFFRKLIKGGYAAPKDWNEETEKQYQLARKNVCTVANNLVEAGFAVIIDDTIWQRRLVEEYQRQLRGAPIIFAYLKPSLHVAQQRNRERTIWNIDPDLIQQSYQLYASEQIEEIADIILDNSNQSVEQSVQTLMSIISELS